MTTKTTTQKTSATRERPEASELQLAFECHTLAQMLYGHIATTWPWLAQMPQPGFGPTMASPHSAPWEPIGRTDSTGWGR